MAKKYTDTLADLIFNPIGDLDEAGLPVWFCAAHSRRKQFPELELGHLVFTVDQFKAYHPAGFRNSMAAVQACKKIVTGLLEKGELYYQQ